MLSAREMIEKVKGVLMPILTDEAIELVEIDFIPSGKRWMLRIYINKKGGVTIADCEKINRELGRVLDVEDFFDHPYTLEVSSPGLTRELKTKEAFIQNKGNLCRIITKEKIDGKSEFKGTIVHANDNSIEIKGNNDIFTIPIHTIKKAHLVFEP
ncbi:MAG TPA: ribosome maturation factor RimP [Deltaproteobacteria bacterium]|nr:ribosome maturation factor RimP [Deltaproteobacteria bacterium]